MNIGKIPNKTLQKLIINPILSNLKQRDEVIIRPNIGEDCTAVFTDDEYCILSTDPITGALEDIGRLAVNINSNDIAASGGIPIGIMVTILLPPSCEESDLQKIMKDIYTEAEKLNIEILGGHTEVTDAVNKPVISSTVIGKTVNKKFISSSGALPGQDVIMTKWAAIEGTSIIAKDFKNELTGFINNDEILMAQNLNRHLSVAEEALIARNFGATCMHDVTEGGILGACWEIAECSKMGIEIYEREIPILDITKKICKRFTLNPLKLISSGSMLITAFNGYELKNKLEDAGINAEVIGKITSNNKKLIWVDDVDMSINEPESDELYKLNYFTE